MTFMGIMFMHSDIVNLVTAKQKTHTLIITPIRGKVCERLCQSKFSEQSAGTVYIATIRSCYTHREQL